MRFLLILVVFLLSFFSVNCAGYQLGLAKPKKYDAIQTIAVTPAVNNTQEPKLSSIVTSSVLHKISQDGTYKATSLSKADAELKVTIESIEYTQYSPNRFDVSASDELKNHVKLSWQLIDKGGNEIGEGSSSGSTNFFADSNLENARQNAIPVAIADAAQKIVFSLALGF